MMPRPVRRSQSTGVSRSGSGSRVEPDLPTGNAIRRDMTRLHQRLQPKPDGEPPVRHRTGVVNAVNSDGTVDLDLGGVVVPDVCTLAGTFMDVGDVVQASVWAGDMLVLGQVASAGGGGPRGWLGYAQVTANQTGITTETALTGLSITITVPASRRIKLTGSIRYGGTTVDDVATMRIKESTTVLQTAEMSIGRNTTQANPFIERAVVIVPSAAAHTYHLTLERPIGTGNMTMVASGVSPAFILAEDLGPS